MTGKQKCDYLRKIRKSIAEDNNIEYYTEDCNFHGECLGTCPKCEEELKYLNDKIEEKRKNGEKIILDSDNVKYLNSNVSLDLDLNYHNDKPIIVQPLMGIIAHPTTMNDSLDNTKKGIIKNTLKKLFKGKK